MGTGQDGPGGGWLGVGRCTGIDNVQGLTDVHCRVCEAASGDHCVVQKELSSVLCGDPDRMG